MPWKQLGLIALILAIFASSVVWFLNTHELKEVTEYTGYKGEARKNNLFAARHFLQDMGIPSLRKDALADLPDADSVIVLNTQRYVLNEKKIDQLLAWVEKGGHLITVARVDSSSDSASDNEDSTTRRKNIDLLQKKLAIDIGAHVYVEEDNLPITLAIEGAARPLALELYFFNELLPANAEASAYQIQDKTWLVQQPYGQGLVSLASRLDFIDNDEIANEDHAEIFWHLVHSHGEVNKVWLLHSENLPSLFQLLREHAWPLLSLLAFGILMIFWALMPRFGVVMAEQPPLRRRILEHIQASGRFMWKRQPQGKAQLTASLQQEIRQLAHARLPGWRWLTADLQQQQLVAWLQWPSDRSAYLGHLLTAKTLDDAAFTQLAQVATLLRKKI